MEPSPELNTLSTLGIVDLEVVLKEVEEDSELQRLVEDLKKNRGEGNKYRWENGRLLYKRRLVLSKNSMLIPNLWLTFHDSILGGYSEFLRTYKRMNGELHWKGMKTDAKKYIEQCDTRQRNKYEATKPAGLLKPIPIPDRILEDWSR